MYALTEKEDKSNGVEITTYATITFGILESSTGSDYDGDTFGLGVANQFWPMDSYTDQNDYFVGPIMEMKLGTEIIFDFAGEREINGGGFMFEVTWGAEYQYNHIEHEFTTAYQAWLGKWANKFGAGVQANLLSLEQSARAQKFHAFVADLGGAVTRVQNCGAENSVIYNRF